MKKCVDDAGIIFAVLVARECPTEGVRLGKAQDCLAQSTGMIALPGMKAAQLREALHLEYPRPGKLRIHHDPKHAVSAQTLTEGAQRRLRVLEVHQDAVALDDIKLASGPGGFVVEIAMGELDIPHQMERTTAPRDTETVLTDIGSEDLGLRVRDTKNVRLKRSAPCYPDAGACGRLSAAAPIPEVVAMELPRMHGGHRRQQRDVWIRPALVLASNRRDHAGTVSSETCPRSATQASITCA